MCAAEAFFNQQISSTQLRQVISRATTVKPNQKDFKIRTVRSRCLHFRNVIFGYGASSCFTVEKTWLLGSGMHGILHGKTRGSTVTTFCFSKCKSRRLTVRFSEYKNLHFVANKERGHFVCSRSVFQETNFFETVSSSDFDGNHGETEPKRFQNPYGALLVFTFSKSYFWQRHRRKVPRLRKFIFEIINLAQAAFQNAPPAKFKLQN